MSIVALRHCHVTIYFRSRDNCTFFCSMPPDCTTLSITSGSVEAPKGTTYGEVAIASCDEGYSLQGTAFITCNDDGTWSSSPTCLIKGTCVLQFTFCLDTYQV